MYDKCPGQSMNQMLVKVNLLIQNTVNQMKQQIYGNNKLIRFLPKKTQSWWIAKYIYLIIIINVQKNTTAKHNLYKRNENASRRRLILIVKQTVT